MPVSAISSASLSTSLGRSRIVMISRLTNAYACSARLAAAVARVGVGRAGGLQKRHVQRRADNVVRIVEQGFAWAGEGGRRVQRADPTPERSLIRWQLSGNPLTTQARPGDTAAACCTLTRGIISVTSPPTISAPAISTSPNVTLCVASLTMPSTYGLT